MLKSVVAVFIFVVFMQNLYAQAQPACQSAEHRQFDFWVGEWDLQWKDAEGNMQKGHNSIKSIMNGCVIEENFDGGESMPLRGLSVSVYNPRKKLWLQTWVDNNGSYLDFEGGMQDDRMVLSRRVETKKGVIMQRMIFYDIEKNSLSWDWETSQDEGKTWKLAWRIQYTRS